MSTAEIAPLSTKRARIAHGLKIWPEMPLPKGLSGATGGERVNAESLRTGGRGSDCLAGDLLRHEVLLIERGQRRRAGTRNRGRPVGQVAQVFEGKADNEASCSMPERWTERLR